MLRSSTSSFSSRHWIDLIVYNVNIRLNTDLLKIIVQYKESIIMKINTYLSYKIFIMIGINTRVDRKFNLFIF